MTDQAHRLTPLAILVVFVLAIPGSVLGQVVSLVYGFFLGGFFDGNLFNWITGGWFKIITMAFIPNALAGGIAGFFALRVTFAIKPLKQANYEIAAYAMSAIVVLLGVLGLLTIFAREGLSTHLIESVSNAAGVIVGLFAAQQAVREDQSRVMASA